MQDQEANEAVVIGAGVVGLSVAIALQSEGRTVTVLDKSGVAQGASAGNAGMLAFSEIMPHASPGIMRQAPRWLADPLGPLSIRPAYAVKILPFLARFSAASRPAIYRRILAAQASFMPMAEEAFDRLVSSAALARHVQTTGTLSLYDTQASFAASAAEWEIRRQAGISFQEIAGAEIDALQPGLAPQLRGLARYVPGGRQVVDPRLYTEALAAHFEARGGKLERAEVLKVEAMERGARLILPGGRQRKAATVVLCAGAWSKTLAAWLGDRIPLETERGYNTTLAPGAFDLRRQIYFPDHGFVATPVGGGVRIGGAVELGGLALPPNYRRADAMLAKAARFLPGLKTNGGTQWMGFRPSMPDTLAVIGPSSASRDIVYAFGHGHLGLTQSAGTGRLVADLLAGRQAPIDMAPFAPARFR